VFVESHDSVEIYIAGIVGEVGFVNLWIGPITVQVLGRGCMIYHSKSQVL